MNATNKQRRQSGCANRAWCRLNRLWLRVAAFLLLGAGVSPAAEQPKPASQPARFPLTEEQVMGPQFLDHVREAFEQWSLESYDPKTGGFLGGIRTKDTSDVIWIRYACNAADLGAPDRKQIVAFLDERLDSDLWMATRAIRILGGEPTRVSKKYFDKSAGIDLTTPAAYRKFAEASKGDPIHSYLPLIASGGKEYVDIMYDVLGKRMLEDGTFGGFRPDFKATVFYSATGRLPPHPEKILARYLPSGDGPLTAGYIGGDGFEAMDKFYLIVRLSIGLGPEVADKVRARYRAGLNQSRRAFLALQKNPGHFKTGGIHLFLAAIHGLGLLQEMLPDELPSQRPYRFGWEMADHYNCAVIRAAIAEHAESPPADGKKGETHENAK